jgi:hypothetical protein
VRKILHKERAAIEPDTQKRLRAILQSPRLMLTNVQLDHITDSGYAKTATVNATLFIDYDSYVKNIEPIISNMSHRIRRVYKNQTNAKD